jgi:hypothetical protein
METAVYLALFRVVAIADLDSPERAVEWARTMLEDDQLLEAFVARASDEEVDPRPVLRFGHEPAPGWAPSALSS